MGKNSLRRHHKKHGRIQVVQVALSPLEYLRRAFVALFKSQKYRLCSEAQTSRASLVIFIATLIGFDVTTVMACLELNGTPMEIMGQTKVKEVFVAGIEKPALHIMLNDPVTTKDGSSFGENSPIEDVPMVGSPMVLDEEQWMERTMKRPREVEDEEDEPLILKHRKQTRMGTLWILRRHLLQEEHTREGPSDPNAEVWEEIWDEDLAKMFREHNRTQEEVKIIGAQGARARGRTRKDDIEVTILKDFNDVELTPRVDIDSIVGDNGEVSDWEFQDCEFDAYTPLTCEEMLGFDIEKAQKIGEANKGYED